MDSHDTEANKALVRRYLDTLNGQPKTAELIRSFVSDRSLVEHVLAFEAAFPGYKLLVDDVIAEGDKVVVRVHSQQRHDGDFMGIPPTGKEFSITGMIIYRIEDGLIAEHWLNVDTGALMQHVQSGAAQPVGAS